MEKCVETIQTRCECYASVCLPVSSYHIEAHIDCVSDDSDRILKISINPPLNDHSEYKLPYDGSTLPENMIKHWLESKIAQEQEIHSFDIVSSAERKQDFNVEENCPMNIFKE